MHEPAKKKKRRNRNLWIGITVGIWQEMIINAFPVPLHCSLNKNYEDLLMHTLALTYYLLYTRDYVILRRYC